MAPDSDTELSSVSSVLTVCGAGTCPTVYTSNRGTVVIQGWDTAPTELGGAVEIPIELAMQAAEKLGLLPARQGQGTAA